MTVANGLSADDLRRQLDVVAELNESLAPFRLLTGIEVDILDDGQLDQEEDLLAALDVVVASVHSKLRMESPEMTRRMTVAVENPHIHILGMHRAADHRPGTPTVDVRPRGRFRRLRERRYGGRDQLPPDRRDLPEDLLRLAAAAGCQFSIDSDVHAPGQLSWFRLGCEQAVAAEIPASSIAIPCLSRISSPGPRLTSGLLKAAQRSPSGTPRGARPAREGAAGYRHRSAGTVRTGLTGPPETEVPSARLSRGAETGTWPRLAWRGIHVF